MNSTFSRAAIVLALACASRASAQMKMAPDPLGVTMNRAASGTTWTPDAISLPSLHIMRGNWDYMVHGFVFGQYDYQGGPRGDDQLGSLNWGMFMATHELAGGRFSFRTMLSLDPWTVTARGYPLLLQTGETYRDEPLRDRQHPHDFWMELGATWERAVTDKWGVSLYAAPSGEPALSPVAFMHRQSAMDNPFAPLAHHWQDATHVSFGVLTGGIFGNKWKIEGSVFNGREPDESRWNLEKITLDSYSGRITVNPTANWSATLGYGFMKSPERLEPTESMQRVAASLLHGVKLGADGQVATTFAYGGNIHHGELSSSFLAESEAILNRRSTLIGRVEFIRKSEEELIPIGFRGARPPDQMHPLVAMTAGYIHEIIPMSKATIGVGATGTLNVVPSDLESYYGSRTPSAFAVFVRLRPVFAAKAQVHSH